MDHTEASGVLHANALYARGDPRGRCPEETDIADERFHAWPELRLEGGLLGALFLDDVSFGGDGLLEGWCGAELAGREEGVDREGEKIAREEGADVSVEIGARIMDCDLACWVVC